MTAICGFIEMYESAVWRYLSRVFSYSLKGSELGFTNDLIFRITEFYNGYPLSCEVYSFHALNEPVRGADIDLFIQNGGLYYHFMIQSKIMNFIGVYYDIERYIPANHAQTQYNKLISNSTAEGAFPLYLFYNGKTQNSTLGNVQLGCSIVDANIVQNFRIAQHTATPNARRIRRPTFNDFHPNMKPLHYLFCDDCSTDFKLPDGKKYEDIYKGYPYKKILSVPEENTKVILEDKDELNEEEKNIIETKHLAPIRIIIKEENKK